MKFNVILKYEWLLRLDYSTFNAEVTDELIGHNVVLLCLI